MLELVIAIIIAVVILSVALWAIAEIAPPDLNRVLRVVAIALFLIWLLLKVWPFLVAA